LEGAHGKVAFRLADLAMPAPGEFVLDLGCGTGLLTAWLAERVGSKGSVVGVDLSTGMLARAKSRNASMTNVSFHQASIDDLLWFRDHSFDLILLSDSLTYLQSPSLTLRETFRVLRPGGRLILSVVRRSLATRAHEISLQLLERELKNHPLSLPDHSVTRILLGEPNSLAVLLQESGFTSHTLSTSVNGLRVRSCHDWLELLRLSCPRYHLLLGTLGSSTRARFYDRMEWAMRKLGSESFRYHLACTIAVARYSTGSAVTRRTPKSSPSWE
ncbi:MAG: class I SAM-dependent methyltransferase, partial [Candidatus Dormibacteraceae bacterium]